MADRRILSPGTVTFEVDGQEFSMDIVEALRRMQEIADNCKELTKFEYLDSVICWIEAEHGIRLSLSQARSLWAQIPDAYEVFLSKHAGGFNGVRKSPSSTASPRTS